METELCALARKYKSDKCHEFGHFYTPKYYEFLKDKKYTIKKVLEIGIGTPEVMFWLQEYKPGASLKMWRDFFPNAHIYGIDIVQSAIFEEERITTFLLNSLHKQNMVKLIKDIGADIDLVVDDGNHRVKAQIRTFNNLRPLLKKDVIYIIEDVKDPQAIVVALPDYKCEVFEFLPKRKQNCFILVKNV